MKYRCHTHISCGEDISYIMALRMGGDGAFDFRISAEQRQQKQRKSGNSLRSYIRFVERELTDAETGEIFNDIGRGGINEILIRVDHTRLPADRWYSGAGNRWCIFQFWTILWRMRE